MTLSLHSVQRRAVAFVLACIDRRSMSMAASGLPRNASHTITPKTTVPFSLVFSRGSVVDFTYPKNPEKAAIVNAANEMCLGGGGVDGAISDAGGPTLLSDRKDLPLLTRGIRCPTGGAKITGPGSYGELKVSYVIHAVGPNYNSLPSLGTGDELLRSAYAESLERAKEEKLEAVAFSLLSAGIFRGSRSSKEVLKIGVETIRDFEGYEELKEVHMCAFSSKEGETLTEIAAEVDLSSDSSSSTEL